MPRPVPSLATGPNALTSEVAAALTTVVSYDDDLDSAAAALAAKTAAIRAWFVAATEAILRSGRASPYNDAGADAKNANLEAALADLLAAL